MTKARDLSNLANGVPNSLINLDSAEIPNLDASKITTGELANAKASALAKLSALGLTEEEVKAIL